MDYVTTFPNTYICYYASDMVLHVDSDATYLVTTKARSRMAGYCQLSAHPDITAHPKLNGTILIECKTLRHIVVSAAEAEIGGIFHNTQVSIPIRTLLQSFGHPLTPIKTYNSTANGFIHEKIH